MINHKLVETRHIKMDQEEAHPSEQASVWRRSDQNGCRIELVAQVNLQSSHLTALTVNFFV